MRTSDNTIAISAQSTSVLITIYISSTALAPHIKQVATVNWLPEDILLLPPSEEK